LEAVLEAIAEASHRTSLMFLCLIQMSKCIKSDDDNDMMMMIVMMLMMLLMIIMMMMML